ncbi:MarR family winged helix-turn-helix transcriptional regulator [Mycolicibacterium gilvum]|uniref:Transcriptional regulator, MarR family n=1 Tax=Mycolicibacterium gilvum (strain DSM 45189 / LMG 24558 / Spyr1) TaxID=278137 RepID=E6TNK4_MYCSR|nr:MarR family winged helix-turn-helix transcriptional regulator [Mycolicibacterium gilvum]ADU01681.1 transcriptional regulator, MarR family [Mycolicibacterium gilvum Spyr1]
MCYAYFVRCRYDQLDDLLTRLHLARQRPQWRRRVLGPDSPVSGVSTIRVLRAVEQFDESGGASVRDVADFLAVEQSTASRLVAPAVAAGLLTKSSAADDQRRRTLVLTEVGRKELAEIAERRRELVAETVADLPDSDVDTLVELLGRITDRFERAAR